MQESYVCRLLAMRLIKAGLCSGSSPFGTEEEPKAASVAAVVGSSKVGQTERHTYAFIFNVPCGTDALDHEKFVIRNGSLQLYAPVYILTCHAW